MTGLLGRLGRALRSQALAVALLIAIAVLAAVGTVTSPPGSGEVAGRGPLARAIGVERTFSSPLFLALVAAAALNVAVCTWHRLAPRLRARKGGWRAFTDLALHGSLLLILAGGAAKGAFGFTGTQNVHVGGYTDTVYDWRGGWTRRSGSASASRSSRSATTRRGPGSGCGARARARRWPCSRRWRGGGRRRARTAPSASASRASTRRPPRCGSRSARRGEAKFSRSTPAGARLRRPAPATTR